MIFVGSRPIQITRDGSFEPLHLGTVRLSSSTIALDVAASSGFPISRGDPMEAEDRLYGRFSVRSMRRLRPRTVIGIRWWTRNTSSARCSLEYTKNAYFESGPMMTTSLLSKTQNVQGKGIAYA